MDAASGETAMFLIGKTGHGKSSTGNNILGREAFNTSDGGESDTYLTQAGWGRFGQRVVKVVDGPGVCETRLTQGNAAKKMLDDMRAGVFLCPEGFDALLLVLRYGIRFTKEELEAVRALKSCFGDRFLKDFGILVLTHGEQFDMENLKRKTKTTLEEWVGKQTGELQELLREFEGRHVLFHNMDESRRDEEVSQLLSMVDGLKRRGVRYTKHLFEQIKAEHEKYFARENATELKETLQRKIDLLQDSLNQVINMDDRCDISYVNEKLDQLLKDVWHLKHEITQEDKQTGILRSLQSTVENMETTIRAHKQGLQSRQTAEAVRAERAELVAKMEQIQRDLDQAKAENTPQEGVDYAAALTAIGSFLAGAAVLMKEVMSAIPDDEQQPRSTPQITEVDSDDSDHDMH